MTLTLAVDTTAEFGSIALADEDDATGVREEVRVQAPQGFSQVLFGEIEALLKRQGVRLNEIDLFAGASGPGSFTGVRVGLAAIKGLAEVLGRPVVAVSNLEALAGFGKTNARATIIDARRGEVYAALYDGAGNQIIPEEVLPIERFKEALAGRNVDWNDVEWISQPDSGQMPLAGAIARIAIRKAKQGLARDPAAIEANYVRRSDAELLWKEI
jgi:tRNA threonylcarbamoyladenosine biosynthesis protein TsaB